MIRTTWGRAFALLSVTLSSTTLVRADDFTANPLAASGDPDYYQTLVDNLRPGDTLHLPAGTYMPDSDGRGLNLVGISGTSDAWIVIKGPDSGDPAIIKAVSDRHNNVQMGDNAYIALKNLTIDSSDIGGVDAINTDKGITHDIVIENCSFIAVSGGVAINTKAPAWNWVIRNNAIVGASTGMYIGNPNGTGQFINGLIEGNLIKDTIGYNIQFKKQLSYGGSSWEPDVPPGPHTTVVRNNVFIKELQTSRPRPNLMIRGFPDSGPNAADRYEVYGNFFFQNHDEPLIYAVTNATIHDNILVTGDSYGIQMQNHEGEVPEVIHIYNNTIFGPTVSGIRFSSPVRDEAIVLGNAIFAGGSVEGPGVGSVSVSDNVFDSVPSAGEYVVNPSFVLGQMDFYPLTGKLTGQPLDLSGFSADLDSNLDFNGDSKGDNAYRGAYAGEAINPGWVLSDAKKVGGPASPVGDSEMRATPMPPTDLVVQ